MTIEEVQARLTVAHARIGHEGRFALTLSLNLTGQEECYVTHWFRPDPHAFEDCKAVGSGTIAECLTALDRYVAAYRRRPTVEEVGRTLGLPVSGLPISGLPISDGSPSAGGEAGAQVRTDLRSPRARKTVLMAAE